MRACFGVFKAVGNGGGHVMRACFGVFKAVGNGGGQVRNRWGFGQRGTAAGSLRWAE